MALIHQRNSSRLLLLLLLLETADYRPMSILLIYLTILKTLVLVCSSDALDKYDLMFDHPFGIQKSKSTSFSLHDMTSKSVLKMVLSQIYSLANFYSTMVDHLTLSITRFFHLNCIAVGQEE